MEILFASKLKKKEKNKHLTEPSEVSLVRKVQRRDGEMNAENDFEPEDWFWDDIDPEEYEEEEDGE
jgi:hypothetical protein